MEGRQAVRELLAARRRQVSEVWMTEGSDPSTILGEIDRLAREAHVPVRLVSSRRLEGVQGTDTPQGVVAFAEPLTAARLDELVLGAQTAAKEDEAGKEGEAEAEEGTEKAGRQAEAGAPPFLVLVEGITDPHNLGAILRSAECAGASGAAVPRHRAVHVTPAVAKAAAGAIEHLPIALVAGMPSALQELERLGVLSVGLDERATVSFYDLQLGDRPVAVVLGSEGSGLSPLARRRCEALARIPVAGAIPSLNVSTAAAVACFEVARQRRERASGS